MDRDSPFPRKKVSFGWPFILVPATALATVLGFNIYQGSVDKRIKEELTSKTKGQNPYIIIGYDRTDNVLFDPTNSLPKPSISTLEGEYQHSLNNRYPKENRDPDFFRAESISGALRLGKICEESGLSYQFSGLTRSGANPYVGMLERGVPAGSRPVLVYCLPTIRPELAKDIERAHEYAHKTDVASYLFNDSKLEEIAFGEKK